MKGAENNSKSVRLVSSCCDENKAKRAVRGIDRRMIGGQPAGFVTAEGITHKCHVLASNRHLATAQEHGTCHEPSTDAILPTYRPDGSDTGGAVFHRDIHMVV